jgi:uncharacterized protein (DUF2235 family)
MKRLIVCTDGTWNARDPRVKDGTGFTNVAKLAEAIAERGADGIAQEVYYHAGVGTGHWWDRVVGGAFGVGISRTIKECYGWLVERYEPGDELHLFGFSRGAYTARSIIGFVRNCGILRREHKGRIDEAYDFYRNRAPETHPRSALAAAFRGQYAHTEQVSIKCVGVWDTVGSLGVPTSGLVGWWTRKRYGFHDVTLSSWVENAFHALAIDERRKPFAPTLWEVTDADRKKPGFNQRLEQVWFAGVHSNVGGGYPDWQLSDLTLAWMYAKATDSGLTLKPNARESLRGHCCGTIYDSMTLFYRAFGVLTRIVDMKRVDGAGHPLHTFESVDKSAFDRRRTFEPRYDPENIRGFREPASVGPA